MFIAKKALPRRTVLRGLGAAVALPLLDAMVPAMTALRASEAQPVRRFGAIYIPNGIMMPSWTPAVAGTAFEFSPILQPLAPFRNHVLVVSGLNGAGPSGHANASTRFLTGVTYRGIGTGMDLFADVSIDQILAREFGQHTQLASLELSLDSNDLLGSCNANFSCTYTHTISWRSASTALPMENDPRAVFERLFGDSGSTEPTARLAQIRRERSLLDAVTGKLARLERDLGSADHARLDEYVESVRDLERRIQKAEEQSSRELPLVESPGGIPPVYEDYAKLMFDLQLLAYQCDLTRIVTFMMGREQSGRPFPEIDVADAWHPTSHHGNDPKKIAVMTKINTFHSTLFAYCLKKLGETPDGDGSLLDHMLILYGAGMSDSDAHDPKNMPLLLAGGGAGQFRGGRHLTFPEDTPTANLLVTILDKFGVRRENIGNSNGKIEVDALSVG